MDVEEASVAGVGGGDGTARSGLAKLSLLLSAYDLDPSPGAAALLAETRKVFRSIGGDLPRSDYRTLEALAVRMYDLQMPANEDPEKCADLRQFACRLLEKCLESAGGEHGAAGQEKRKELLSFLCECENQTAAAFQKCGAHAKAVGTLEKARSNVEKALSLGVHAQDAVERLLRLQMEVYYKKIELLSALESIPTYAGKSKLVVQEVRQIIDHRQLPAAFSYKFGTLCYNLSVQHIKNEEGCHEAAGEALFWSEQAAQFFGGQSCRAEHAASKSLSAKARISVNDMENALRDLSVANMLDPTPRSILLELQCLTLMQRHDEANALLAKAITEEGWKACSTERDSEAKRTLIKAWIRFALFLAEANLADAANETFGRVVTIAHSDPDYRFYEEAHIHWITALACSGIRDLAMCFAQVQALTRHHVEVQCSPLTQKRMLVLFTKVIEELDATGSNRKAIEWRQKAISWASEADGNAIAKQIVRIGIRVGAMDIAEQYLARCGTHDCDLLILKLQALFKQAKPGDGTEDAAVAMLEEMLGFRSDLSALEKFEVLNAAFTEAHSAGYAVCARNVMQRFVERILSCTPAELKDVVVHQIFANALQLLVSSAPKDGEKAPEFALAAGVQDGDVVEVLSKASEYIDMHGIESFGLGQDQAQQTLLLLSVVSWNMAVKLGDTTAAGSNTPDYLAMSRLYHKCASFLVHRLGQVTDRAHAADACISLYLSSACTLLSHRSTADTRAEHKDLEKAIESVGTIRHVRTKYGLTANPNSSLAESRLEFELGCLLGTDGSALQNMGSVFVEEVLPTLKNGEAKMAGLKAFVGICARTRAPWLVTRDLCEATLSLVAEGETAAGDLVPVVADVQMLRIARSSEEGEEKILYFDDLLTTAKAHPSVFPSAHMHQAAVIAFNKGDLHLHWERPKQAEQWIGMAVKIATASRGVPAESKDKMQEAYTSCLEALRA